MLGLFKRNLKVSNEATKNTACFFLARPGFEYGAPTPRSHLEAGNGTMWRVMYRLKTAGTDQVSFESVPVLMVVKIIWSTSVQ